MNINRTARIASIIEKRRPLAQKIEGVEANLKSLTSALRNLEDNRNQLLARVDDANVIGQLKEIDNDVRLGWLIDSATQNPASGNLSSGTGGRGVEVSDISIR